MQEKTKKLFMYETNYALIGVAVLSLVLPILGIVFFPEILWLGLICIVLSLLEIGFMLYENVFTPIYISENGIKFKSRTYNWDDIKITLYPTRDNLICYTYYIIISDKYYKNFKYNKQIKKEIMKCPKIYLKFTPLKALLQYYKSKLLVVDIDGINEGLPNSTKKINELINNFNSRFAEEIII